MKTWAAATMSLSSACAALSASDPNIEFMALSAVDMYTSTAISFQQVQNDINSGGCPNYNMKVYVQNVTGTCAFEFRCLNTVAET